MYGCSNNLTIWTRSVILTLGEGKDVPQELGGPDTSPMYYRLKELLRKELAGGQYPPGTLVPSEFDLVARFGVSRSTVRRAVQELEMAGLVVRRQGKGTFVAEPKLEDDLLGGYFIKQMSDKGLHVSIRVLDKGLSSSSCHEQQLFGLQPADKVFHVTRLILVEAEPIFVEGWQIPEKTYPDLFEHDLSQPFHRVLDRQYQLSPFRVVKYIEPALPQTYERRYLGIKANQPVMLMERVSYPEVGEVALLSCKWTIRGDRCRHLIRVGF